MKYYEVRRTRTAKAVGSKEEYAAWDRERKQFETIAEVKAFLKEEYGKCKRSKIYRDPKDGKVIHIGYCYHYNTPRASYDDVAHYNIDWVEVSEIKATPVIVA